MQLPSRKRQFAALVQYASKGFNPAPFVALHPFRTRMESENNKKNPRPGRGAGSRRHGSTQPAAGFNGKTSWKYKKQWKRPGLEGSRNSSSGIAPTSSEGCSSRKPGPLTEADLQDDFFESSGNPF
jgi:hypothetical protein